MFAMTVELKQKVVKNVVLNKLSFNIKKSIKQKQGMGLSRENMTVVELSPTSQGDT